MKHLYSLSLLLLALLLPATAIAHDFYVNGIFYKINGNEAIVTYRGTSSSQYSNEYSGDVTIPTSVTYNSTTYSVTSIDDHAFQYCSGLTSIDVPNSVTIIGGYAFYGCSGMFRVNIPNSVTSIGEEAFGGCTGLTSIDIPNSITTIGNYAFHGCSGLTNITVAGNNPKYDSRGNCNAIIETASNTLITGCQNTVIPNSVTSIGVWAFSGCTGLTSIDIPNSVTSIGSSAFSGCSGLTSVTIGNSVTSISFAAFSGCSGLTSIDIPDSVTKIEQYAFSGCSGLVSITIGYSVTTIADDSFIGCSGITDLVWNARSCSSRGIPTSNIERVTIGSEVVALPSSFMSGSKITSVIIPNTVTSIGNYAFSRCNNLTIIVVASGNTTYDSRDNCNAIIETATNTLIVGCQTTTIPNSVTHIGDYAFYGCSGLTSITIGNSVTHIGDYAFYNCSGLTSVTIGNSVTSIGGYAFNYCSGLTSIEIPNSVTSISWGAFSYCSGLTSITVAGDNPKYDSPNNCNAIIETATNTLVVGCKNSTIPNTVTSIGHGAFWGCSGLTSIDIPNSVTTIGVYAFCDCSGLTSVTIPNTVTTIGMDAFNMMEYSSMTRVNISDIAAWCNIEFEDMFANPLNCCGRLYLNGSEITELTIPNSVTNIKDYAFIRCSGLTSVTIPNSVTSIGIDAFEGCWDLTEIYCLALVPPTMYDDTFYGSYDATLYVPDIVLESYKAADYWNNFTNIVGMPYTFKVDGTSYHATTMNTASVMANNDDATLYTGDMVIPDSVTYAGMTFAVTGFENNAFDGCFELKSVVIPNTVETIGEQAFQGCTGLTSVNIGSGVTAIGAKAFNYCNALDTVKCLGTVPPVMASSDCFSTAAYNRATLLVPRNSEATYAAADYWYKFAHIDGWGSAGRGDIDGDGLVSIKDVTFLIDAILTGEHEGVYFESADLNSNGRLDIGDVTSLIDELLNGND